jgi:16S rRNA (guanine966-N2)-methyltransferase
MRVIAGSSKGLPLMSVPGDSTRPMLDRVKTPLFDILRDYLTSSTLVLDAFAGTGALGIEALSRGAARTIFLDLHKGAIATIHANLEKTSLAGRAEVRHVDAFTYVRATSKQFDIVFCDPPQFKSLASEFFTCISERPYVMSPEGTIVIKIHPDEADDSLQSTSLKIVDRRKYGNSLLLFARKNGL